MNCPAAFAIALSWALLAMAARADTEWPAQLEVSVPFAPTPFQAEGQSHLVFEVYLRNFSSEGVDVRSLEVLDPAGGPKPLRVFSGGELASMTVAIGRTTSEAGERSRLPAGGSDVVFLWISLDASARVPPRVLVRVHLDGNAMVSVPVDTRSTPREIRAPVTGTGWQANDAPSNDPENHHRRGVLVVNGRAVISRRYAIDWVKIENGKTFAGDVRDVRLYHAYKQPVFAVADARVVSVNDGMPDNVPGHGADFHPAAPITFVTVCGNRITLDLGHGQFAHYFHLRAGSLRVKVGDRVKGGQPLAQIGGSGDAREPHLHFEITTSSEPIAGEGLPYIVDAFEQSATDHSPAIRRKRELPLSGDVVDFER